MLERKIGNSSPEKDNYTDLSKQFVVKIHNIVPYLEQISNARGSLEKI